MLRAMSSLIETGPARTLAAIAAGLLLAAGPGAAGRPADRLADVDGKGVLRWRDGGAEVALFGVNYYAPCHWNYRDIAALGLSHTNVIDRDVAHLARLGLDALRLHVFDREVSDASGNLLDNAHLRLLDHLIARAKARGLYTVLTPIAWWGVPGASPGFSTRFTMQQMTTDPAARPPQTNYLAQFVRHVNPLTGLAYKDDPAVIAFELINEPLYPPDTTDAQVTAYVNALADAIRAAGCRKPLFYNAWAGRMQAVAAARVEGASFGWYPTGLVAGRAWQRNALPLVDRYGGTAWNPPMDAPPMAGKARIVYEFDAADVSGCYLYPALARTFRAGGAQIATQFQYDPLPVAPFNAGWQTHYLNLSCTPRKALSFAIAAEAFRRLPRLRTYPPHPAGDRFEGFRVSYEEDLSEYADASTFMYANTTTSAPPSPRSLTRIAGCGSSPVARYAGTGAYFLDRLADGLWRLEVHPDAVAIADPFGPDRLGHEVSRVIWRSRELELRLPELGGTFALEPLDAGNTHRATARAGSVTVRPGVYAVRREGVAANLPADASLPAAVGLREFVAPAPAAQPPAAWAPLPAEWVAGRPLPLRITLATDEEPTALALECRSGTNAAVAAVQLTALAAYAWQAVIPGELLRAPAVSLRLAATLGGGAATFPSNGWWTVAVVGAREPLALFDAGRDAVQAHGQTPHRVRAVAGMGAGARAVRLDVDRFDPPPAALTFRHDATDALEARLGDLAGRTSVVVRARAAAPETKWVEVVVIERDGTPWGANVPLTQEWAERSLPLSAFRFFGHWDGAPAGRGGAGDRPDPAQLRAVSLCFGAWLAPGRHDQPHGIEIERVAVE